MRRSIIAGASAALVLVGLAGPALADTKFKMSNEAGANAARRGVDPENPANQVLEIETTAQYPEGAGAVFREIRKNVKVADLKNMLSVKYHFVGRTCAGGSPRFQIKVETTLAKNGSSGNIFGYLGDQPFGGGCPEGVWVFEDMTNGVAKWELSQFTGGGFQHTWDEVIAFFAGDANHRVVSCGLVDDSGSFAPTTVGTAYYDQVQCYDKTLEDHRDTKK